MTAFNLFADEWAVYPDSDKIGVWPGGVGEATDQVILRRGTGVDYWLGE